MTSIEVTFRGPFFSGRAESIGQQILDDVLYEVGNAALERVQYHLNAQIKHPTPYYETQIIQQRLGRDEVVHDRGIVYGPWLEGTSRRNARSRFKGYASFRKATQEVERSAPAIIARVVARNLGRIQ